MTRNPIIGIDLGTTNSVVAACSQLGGPADILVDSQGFKIQPSVVSFHPNGSVVLGAAAKQRKMIDPANTIYSIKRLIGRTYSSPEVTAGKQRLPFEIREGDNEQPIIKTRAGEFAISEISAIVLDHMRKIASQALDAEIERAVVTVPANFTDAQRAATTQAGAIAGITIVRALNEPTAAALAYGYKQKLDDIVAIYDFGGGTFDVSILRAKDNVYEVLGTAGESFLGGDDIDERVVDQMCGQFLREQNIDLRANQVAMQRLRAVAEQIKIELSRRSKARVAIEEIAYGEGGKPLNLNLEISREQFVERIKDVVERTFPVCQEALHQAQLPATAVGDIVLVGGTTKMPYVRERVSQVFGRPPRTNINPDEAVALGAALQAASLEQTLDQPRQRQRRQTYRGIAPGAAPAQQAGEAASQASQAPPIPDRPRRTTAPPPIPPTPPQQTSPPAPPPRTDGERRARPGTHSDSLTSADPSGNETGKSIARIGRSTVPGPCMAQVQPPPPPSPETSTPNAAAGIPDSNDEFQEQPTREHPSLEQLAAEAAAHLETAGSEPEPNHAVHVARENRRSTPPPPPQPSAPLAESVASAPRETGEVAFELPAIEDIATGALSQASEANTVAASATPELPPLTLDASPIESQSLVPLPSEIPGLPEMVDNTSQSREPSQGITLATSGSASMTAVDPPMAIQPPLPQVLDITPRALGIGTIAGYCEELIGRSTTVPTQRAKIFTTSKDEQRTVRIRICQGESRRIDDNVVLGDLVLNDLEPRPRGETKIEVTFEIDASGILHVNAKDSTTGQQQQADLNILGGQSPEQLEAAQQRFRQLRGAS